VQAEKRWELRINPCSRPFGDPILRRRSWTGGPLRSGHQALAVENLALRLQLAAFKRNRFGTVARVCSANFLHPISGP